MYGAKNRKNEPVKYRKTKPVQRMNQPDSALHMTADNRRTRLVHTGNYSVGATAWGNSRENTTSWGPHPKVRAPAAPYA